MISTVFAILLAPAFAFKGGSVRDFSVYLAQYTGSPVIVMRGDAATIKAVNFVPTEKISFQELFRINSTHEATRQKGAFAPKEWPGYIMSPSFRAGMVGPSLPDDIETASVLSFSATNLKFQFAKSGVIRTESLVGLLPEGSLTVHRVYRWTAFAPSQPNWSTPLFMETLAFALGGTLIEKNGEFRIEFEPKAYRRRMLARIDSLIKLAAKSRNEFQTADLKFQREVYKQVSDNDLTKSVETDASYVRFKIAPRTPLWTVMIRRLEAMANRTDVANSGQQGNASLADLVNMLDLNRAVSVDMDSLGRTKVAGWIVGKPKDGIVL